MTPPFNHHFMLFSFNPEASLIKKKKPTTTLLAFPSSFNPKPKQKSLLPKQKKQKPKDPFGIKLTPPFNHHFMLFSFNHKASLIKKKKKTTTLLAFPSSPKPKQKPNSLLPKLSKSQTKQPRASWLSDIACFSLQGELGFASPLPTCCKQI